MQQKGRETSVKHTTYWYSFSMVKKERKGIKERKVDRTSVSTGSPLVSSITSIIPFWYIHVFYYSSKEEHFEHL